MRCFPCYVLVLVSGKNIAGWAIPWILQQEQPTLTGCQPSFKRFSSKLPLRTFSLSIPHLLYTATTFDTPIAFIHKCKSALSCLIHYHCFRQSPSTPTHEGGFVPVVVPCHKGVDAASNDLSWTSGFVDVSRVIGLHYGATTTVEELFPALAAWVNGQLFNATNGSHARPDGLPDYGTSVKYCCAYCESRHADVGVARNMMESSFLPGIEGVCICGRYGDLSSPAYTEPGQSTPETAQRCGAANFLISLQQAIAIAGHEGRNTDVQEWTKTLQRLTAVFDDRFFSDVTSGFAIATANLTRQTMNSIAMAINDISAHHKAAAATALLSDVTDRNFSLTVGSIGQKHLLNTLSDMADPDGHDAALRIALVSSIQFDTALICVLDCALTP